ncbi:hypothetical protein SBA7_1620003 [Candidatus Sulfotelmatobacter sp. SbA7]|jgi:hypothetical protein|nr:hypothetical protein SBA7_1620003 [Candidatus Sulfotelmatobacter sp. SbA7]
MNDSSGGENAGVPTEEEAAHYGRCYAVMMALEANRKVGKASRWILVGAVVGAIYFQNFWFLVAGFVLSVATYFYLTQSCIRFVERTIGMPPEVQTSFSIQYKKDAAFAKEVDEFAHNARKMADALEQHRKSK